MKKAQLITMLLLFAATTLFAQTEEMQKPYNDKADAKKQISDAVAKAKAENKHVYLQVGGNWCSWCLRLHKFYSAEPQIDSILKASYVPVYINYSKENKNMDVMKQLGYPQRFGFPVMVILNADGAHLHTQNSSYLEEGKGYSRDKVFDFLKAWTPAALNPANYKE